jgi:hypothetical protein
MIKISKLTQEEIYSIKKYIEIGKSCNQIANLMNKNKSAIYYHFKKIKGRTVFPIQVESDNDELLGEFIGLFAGDGSFFKSKDFHYHIRLHFNVAEREFVHEVIDNVLYILFNRNPRVYTQQNGLILSYYSRNIYNLVRKYLAWKDNEPKTYSVTLIAQNLSEEFMIGFLRGNVDSDGHISRSKISFDSVSKELINSISICLDHLRIKYKYREYQEKRLNRRNMHNISIHRDYFDKFFYIIKPRNTRNMHRLGHSEKDSFEPR